MDAVLVARPSQRHQRSPSRLTCVCLTPAVFQLANPTLPRGVYPLIRDLARRLAFLLTYRTKLDHFLKFIRDYHETGSAPAKERLIEELRSVRCWKSGKMIDGLLLELESGLLIRPAQVAVANNMMKKENIVQQLNMGEGKSKVITPVVLASLADGQRVVRLTVLKPLLNENLGYLQRTLGGLMGRRVYQFPMTRSIPLTKSVLGVIKRQLEECRTNRGVIVTTPEYRMSLTLKHIESLYHATMAQKAKTLRPIDFEGVVNVDNLFDIMDESDEILRYKSQLIYTMGEKQPIDGGDLRWESHEALMRCIAFARLSTTHPELLPKWARWNTQTEALQALDGMFDDAEWWSFKVPKLENPSYSPCSSID